MGSGVRRSETRRLFVRGAPTSLLCVGCTSWPLTPSVLRQGFGEPTWRTSTTSASQIGFRNTQCWIRSSPFSAAYRPWTDVAQCTARKSRSDGSEVWGSAGGQWGLCVRGPRVCPESLRQGLFSPLTVISTELFHVPFSLHPPPGSSKFKYAIASNLS